MHEIAARFSLRTMSTKEIVEDLLRRLPESASLHDIAREIELAAGGRRQHGSSRLAGECAKLSAIEEQALADEGLSADAREWPAY